MMLLEKVASDSVLLEVVASLGLDTARTCRCALTPYMQCNWEVRC